MTQINFNHFNVLDSSTASSGGGRFLSSPGTASVQQPPHPDVNRTTTNQINFSKVGSVNQEQFQQQTKSGHDQVNQQFHQQQAK